MQNWLDRTITWFSPQAGVRRLRARRAAEALSQLSYDGAKTGRRTDGWTTAGNSANAEIGLSLAKLRERSRDLVRNNPHAAKALRVFVSNAIGTGIVPQSSDPAINDLFKIWADEADADDQLNFWGLQKLVARTVWEAGECLVRFRPRRPQDNMDSVPLQIQLLEPDYLDLAKTEGLDNGNIIHGVEFDAIGTRVAYWMFSEHPGEVVNSFKRVGIQSKRVPASEVLHVYEKLRPGQVRGVPHRLASVMLAMRDMDEYDEAELVRKKIESCFAAMVTQPEGADGPTVGDVSATRDSNQNRIEAFEPGMILYGKPGEDIKFGSPSGSAGYNDYARSQYHRFAAGLGVTYEQLTGDLSMVNYSSYRAGHLEFRGETDDFRWNTFIPMFCVPVWRRFIEAAMVSGKLVQAASAASVKWTAPRYQSVDPLKDAKATLSMIRSGLKTLPEAIAEEGFDPDEQLQEIADTNKKLDSLGVVLDSDPRQDTKPPGDSTNGQQNQDAAA